MRPTGIPTAVGAPSGQQQQCQCGAGMKPGPGTTPPGQPARPVNDMVPYPSQYSQPTRSSFNSGSMQVSRPLPPMPQLFGSPGPSLTQQAMSLWN